jgi:hypothetical protein
MLCKIINCVYYDTIYYSIFLRYNIILKYMNCILIKMTLKNVSYDIYEDILQFLKLNELKNIACCSKQYYEYTKPSIQRRKFNKLSNDALENIFQYCNYKHLYKAIKLKKKYTAIINSILNLHHSPTGTANMSRVDNAGLNFRLNSNHNVPHAYATNYNILRIASGMMGLAYSS